MRRLLLLSFLITVFCSLIFAEVVIEATGEGKTFEEAKEKARIELAEKVFPGTVVVTTSVSTQESSKQSYSSFSQKSSYTVVGEVPGLNYEVVSFQKNNYVVSTKIVGNATTLNFYSRKVTDYKQSVEQFYQQYLNLDSDYSIKPDDLITKKREMLGKVVSSYDGYNIYSNVYILLGGFPDNIDKKIPSFEVLKNDYQSLLNEESNTLNSHSIKTEEILEKLEQNRKAQEEFDNALKEAERQAQLQRERQLAEEIDKIVTSHQEKKTYDDKLNFGFDEVYYYIENIINLRDNLISSCDEYDRIRLATEAENRDSFNKESSAIRNRVYPLGQQADGKPTERAIKLRQEEISNLEKKKNKELEEAYKLIDDKLCVIIQEKFTAFINAINLLETNEFNISCSNNEIEIISTEYNGEYFYWKIKFYLNHPVISGVYEVVLPYTSLTGEKIPSNETEKDKFFSSDAYNDKVTLYTNVFNNKSFDFSLSFKVSFNLSGLCKIVFSGYSISVDDKDLYMAFDKSSDSDGSSFSVKLKRANFDFNKYNWLNVKTISKYTKTEKVEEEKQTSVASTTTVSLSKSTSAGLKLDTKFIFAGQAYISFAAQGKTSKKDSSVDLFLDGRFVFSDMFFLSASPFIRFGTFLEGGLMFGGGFSTNGVTLGARFSISAGGNSALLINPFFSYVIWEETTFDGELLCGIIIDPLYDWVSVSAGFGIIGK